MTLKQLIERADTGYPDGMLMMWFEEPNGNHGDTLAKFIVSELTETFDAEMTDSEQLHEACRVFDRASSDIHGVMRAL